MKIYTRNLLVLLALVLFVTSCTKTRDLPALSKSQMLSFKIPLAGQELVGVIDQSDKSITVYLPFFYQLDVIDPLITLSEGAKLEEESLPVEVTAKDKKYVVIGADNSRETYTLDIQLQFSDPLSINELSTATSTAEMIIGHNTYNLYGNFNTTDASKIAAYIVDADGKEYPFNANTGYGPAAITTLLDANNKKVNSIGFVQVPQNVTPGLYRVRVKSLGFTATTQYPVQLTWGLPVFIYTPVTIKTGETFTLTTSSAAMHDVTEVSFTINGVKKPLEIVSYDYLKVVVRVPADVPVGTYIPTVTMGVGSASPFWGITITQ